MITYVAYIENNEKNLGDFEFLFQAYVDKGLVEVSRWEEEKTDKLRDLIRIFLSRYIHKEWQLIVVDGSVLHNSRNPYKNSGLQQRITKLLYDKKNPLPGPERIYLISQRGELEPVFTAQEGARYDVPFNFLKEYDSPYRFLVLDIPEGESNERSMFRLMCGVLIIVANEWSLEVIERNYLYILSWDIDEQETDDYLGKRQYEFKLIKEALRNELLNHQKNEGGSSLPTYQNHVANLAKNEQVEEFTKKPLSFFANPKEQEIFLWKLNNNRLLDKLESLLKTPVGRWEREITESKNDMLEDLRAIDSQKIALNTSAVSELRENKEKAAEDIFSTELKGKEQKELIRKIKQDVEYMETLIATRMTKVSFVKSLIEFNIGMLIMGFLCFAIGVIEEQKAAIICGLNFSVVVVFMMLIQFFLWQHRNIVKRRMNKAVEKINRSLLSDDIQYNYLLGKIILYKKYSMLEQQQKNIEKMSQQRKVVLNRHFDKLIQSEVYARKLAITMGKKPDIDRVYNVAGIDFCKEPEECPYYYFPYDLQMTADVMVKTGVSTWLPFPFIKQFRIKKECPELINE